MIPSIFRSQKPTIRAQQFPLLSLFDEMNRLFDEPLPGFGGERGAAAFTPRIDVKETATEYVVSGEFAGLEAKDVEIELKDNTLLMKGEKRHEVEHKEGDRVYSERSYGAFSRRIPFDVEVDEDNATAEMKNGVLTVRIPKSEKVVKGAKKVTIKGA